MECCDYILYEGHSRGCSISKCDKYKKGKRKRTFSPSKGLISWKVETSDELTNL